MLSFDDQRWESLKAGYRVPIDLRPLLRRLETDEDTQPVWREIWQELHHQGDVGEGSFVAVPHLVRIHRQRNAVDWNTYAIAVTIELARGEDRNPDVPEWARQAYEDALYELGRIGLEELPRTTDDGETASSILAFLAVLHGARTYGRMMLEYSEEEILEFEEVSLKMGTKDRR